MRIERERRHLDLSLDTVRARDQVALVRRPALHERDVRRATLGRERLRVRRPGLERLQPLLERELAGLGEPLADDRLGRLVVEDECSFRVRDEARRREIRRELAREDQEELFLLRCHRRSAFSKAMRALSSSCCACSQRRRA